MCITLKNANIDDTFIHLETKGKFHTLTYENIVNSNKVSKNAMILPFPTKEGIYVAATEKGEVRLLWETMTTHLPKREMRGESHQTKSLFIQQVGSYMVTQIDDIDELEDIDCSSEMKEWFRKEYPEWRFVVAWFNSDNIGDMHPLKFVYEPFDELIEKGLGFVPMVDSHGKIPNQISPNFHPHQQVLVNNIPVWKEHVPFRTNNRDYWFKMDKFKDWDATRTIGKSFFVESYETMLTTEI